MGEWEIGTDKQDVFGCRGVSKDFASLVLPVERASMGRRLRGEVVHWGIHDYKAGDAQSRVRMHEKVGRSDG